MANSRLDEYLASVEAHLKTLPATEREEQIMELRQHLESAAAAEAASGSTATSAERIAVQQFGSPRRLAWQLNLTGLKRVLPKADSLLLATLYASALTVCQLFDLLLVGKWIRPYFNSYVSNYGPDTAQMAWNPAELFVGFAFGCAVATLAPRNAMRGILFANGLFFAALVTGAGCELAKPWLFSSGFCVTYFGPELTGMLSGAALVAAARQQIKQKQWRRSR